MNRKVKEGKEEIKKVYWYAREKGNRKYISGCKVGNGKKDVKGRKKGEKGRGGNMSQYSLVKYMEKSESIIWLLLTWYI